VFASDCVSELVTEPVDEDVLSVGELVDALIPELVEVS
jgi:hypothetical protein